MKKKITSFFTLPGDFDGDYKSLGDRLGEPSALSDFSFYYRFSLLS
jgi:hypothetical protein